MRRIMKTVTLVFLVFGLMGCGKAKEGPEGTKINVEGLDITIYDVQINEDTKTVQLKASYTENGKLPEETDKIRSNRIGTLELYDLEEEKSNYVATWKGNYHNISEVEDINIGGLNTEYGKYVCHIESIEKIGALKYKVEQSGVEIQAAITPYSFSVQSETDWIGEEEYFAINAIMKGGEKKRIIALPVQKNPLNNDELDYLGDGMHTGMELEHGGITGILNKNIEVEQIEEVELEKYQENK